MSKGEEKSHGRRRPQGPGAPLALALVALVANIMAQSGTEFALRDLQRRAEALTRCAESLGSLIEGWRARRLDDAEFKSYLQERSKLLKDLAKDIQRDPSVRQIHRMKKRSGTPRLELPEKPESLAEAGPLIEQAVEDARLVKIQIEEIRDDYSLPEVDVRELARPSPAELCRRIHKTGELLADLAKQI